MIENNISMPHPVLGIPGDMTGEFKVAFKISIDRNSRQYVFDNIITIITNPYVESLYANKNLDLTVKVSCVPTYKCWVFQNPQKFTIPENDIDLLLEVETFLTASMRIVSYSDITFSDIFDKKEFSLEKNDIVALTGSKKITIAKEHERTSLGSIFRFAKIDPTSPDQELRFTLDEDQIVIHYPNSNSEYDPVTFLFDLKQGVPCTALNLYIIPALVEAFKVSEDDKVDYKVYRWYETLDSLLPNAERTEDHFINAQKVIRIGLPIVMAFEEILKIKNVGK